MGSFNTTCFASQQTIVPQAECLIIPISQSATYRPVEMILDDKVHEQYGIANSTCYPTAFWGYAGPIIKGNYNDYGQFELIDSPSNKNNILSFFNNLHKKLLKINEGENTSHDLPFDFQSIFNPKKNYSFKKLEEIWEKLWEVGQENCLFVTDYNNHPTQLQFAVMHQQTANYLIKSTNSAKNWNNESFEQKEYFTRYIQSKFEKINEVFGSKKDAAGIISFLSMKVTTLDGYRIGESEGAYISNNYDNFNNCMDSFDKYMSKNPNPTTISQEFIDELFDIFKEQINHRYIHSGLDRLNIKLTPMVYADQDYQNEIGNDYTTMVNSVNEAIKLEIKEKYDDEYDDDELTSPIKDNTKESKNDTVFVIAELSFNGNDDFPFEFKSIKEVSSVTDWEKQIKKQIKTEFEEQDGYLTIYHSDNDGTPFESVSEVMSNISFKEISKESFDIIVENFGHEIGNSVSFMDYNHPQKNKINKP